MEMPGSGEQGGRRGRSGLGRRLSRRLSLITKVPNLLGEKVRAEFSSRDSHRHPRRLEVTVIAPDKTQKILNADSSQTVWEMVKRLVAEFSVQTPRLTLAGSRAEVDLEASTALLEGDILIIEEGQRRLNPLGETDVLYRETESFVLDELDYIVALKSIGEQYGSPLRKLGCFQLDEHDRIFDTITDLANVCQTIAEQLKEVLEAWNPESFKIGHLFSKQVWDQYEDYQDMFRKARQLLREKSTDDDFAELCKLRRGAARHTLHSLLDLPVQRLAQYEQYLQTLLTENSVGQNHDDHENIARAKAKAKQAVKRGQEESDLERIQDLFPNDALHLYDRDVLTMRMKGLMRKRSGTAARLQRALSAKSLRPESPPPPPARPASTDKRQFLMEAPVQFTTGVQSQERHLFLFNDLLLVAKARSGGNFKLKDKVRVSELWLTNCSLDEVTELNKSADTSFVLGWPTTNVVATFSTQAGRDLWWSKLSQVLLAEKEKEPVSTNIQVVYYDLNTSIEYCKTFSVGPDETAKDCIRQALEHLEMRGLDPAQFQLWAKTAREEAPYPLIGHERPFAIKLSCLREGLSSEEGFDLDHCNNVHDPLARCHFILRNTCKPNENEVKKSAKKVGRIRIGQVFRRSMSKDSSGCLFGQPLSRVCDGETLPRSVMVMLQQVFAKGPFTQGIFRKSANARLVRELREKLDSGDDVVWEHVPVLVTAALLKDFLRSLPDPLLTSALYPQWKAALDSHNGHNKLVLLKGVLQQLPKVNHSLLAHFLCVLHHISRRSSQNLMSAANLGVCVGPSLLWSDSAGVVEDLRAVPALVECLITNCQFLLGTHVPHLLGDPRDSGTEESDSLRRDDSSIDSLECSPPPRKDKMSLSRDSGLTMSDSQLYTPDEEESGSTSSSGYDPAFDPHTKVTPSLSVPGEYVRVYGGWEERLNPNFSRQAWFRQRSRRLSSAPPSTKPEDAVRRSASEESLLDTPPPPTPPRRSKPDTMNKDNQKLKCEITPMRTNDQLKQSEKCSEVLVSPERVENFKTELVIKPAITFPEDKFGRHPPLRKVTAVHCEVIDTSVPFKENPSHIYGVNCARNLSLSNTELNYTPPKSFDQSFVSQRIPEQIYSTPRSTDKMFRSRASEPSFTMTPQRIPSENFKAIRPQRLTESYSSPRLSETGLGSPRLSDNSLNSSRLSENSHSSPKGSDKSNGRFGNGDYCYAVREDNEEVKNSECDDSSTLSDDDCTPHVSRSNSRGNEVTPKLRHLPPVHVDTCFVRGRLKRKEERAAHRSRSLPPPPPYRPPPQPTVQNRRAPITSYYLGDCSQSQRYVVTRTFMDEESYV